MRDYFVLACMINYAITKAFFQKDDSNGGYSISACFNRWNRLELRIKDYCIWTYHAGRRNDEWRWNKADQQKRTRRVGIIDVTVLFLHTTLLSWKILSSNLKFSTFMKVLFSIVNLDANLSCSLFSWCLIYVMHIIVQTSVIYICLISSVQFLEFLNLAIIWLWMWIFIKIYSSMAFVVERSLKCESKN